MTSDARIKEFVSSGWPRLTDEWVIRELANHISTRLPIYLLPPTTPFEPDLEFETTFKDLFGNWVQLLRTKSWDSKDNLCILLPTGWSDARKEYALDVTASLWLSVRLTKDPPNTEGGQDSRWGRSITLKDTIQRLFPSSENKERKSSPNRMPREITVKSLRRDYKRKIRFTDNLAEHLAMSDDEKEIAVFSLPVYRRAHQLDGDEGPFPKGFCNETLNTLFLLFPPGSRGELGSDHAHSFKRHVFTDDRKRVENLDHYPHWRDRLSLIIDFVENTDHDFDKQAAWATLWFTWLVGIFALISTALSVTSILLAYQANSISSRSLDLAAAQLELSIAELCNDTDIAKKLPRHCRLLEETKSPGYFRSSLNKDEI